MIHNTCIGGNQHGSQGIGGQLHVTGQQTFPMEEAGDIRLHAHRLGIHAHKQVVHGGVGTDGQPQNAAGGNLGAGTETDARIIIQGIMKVSKKKDTEDKVFNNSNITGRNHAIATLADNYHIFYIDMNEAVCDEEGNLNAEYTHDQIHLLGMYNDLWKDFLMTKGISG